MKNIILCLSLLVVFTILFSCTTVNDSRQSGGTEIMSLSYANESEGISMLRVGQYEVYMLVESERDGNTGI